MLLGKLCFSWFDRSEMRVLFGVSLKIQTLLLFLKREVVPTATTTEVKALEYSREMLCSYIVEPPASSSLGCSA